MNTMKIKVYTKYEINRMGLNIKLKCFKVLPNGDRYKLCKDIVMTIDKIYDELFKYKDDDMNFNMINMPDDCYDWDDVIQKSAPEGFYYDQLTVSAIEAEDTSIFNNCILIEKTRYFVSPEDRMLTDVKTDVYMIDTK